MTSMFNEESATSNPVKKSSEIPTLQLHNNDDKTHEEKASDVSVIIDNSIEVLLEDLPKTVCLIKKKQGELPCRNKHDDIRTVFEVKAMDSSNSTEGSFEDLSTRLSSQSYEEEQTGEMPNIQTHTDIEQGDDESNKTFWIADNPTDYFSKCVSIFMNSDEKENTKPPDENSLEHENETTTLMYGIDDSLDNHSKDPSTSSSNSNFYQVTSRELYNNVEQVSDDEVDATTQRKDDSTEDSSKDLLTPSYGDRSTLSYGHMSMDDKTTRETHENANQDNEIEAIDLIRNMDFLIEDSLGELSIVSYEQMSREEKGINLKRNTDKFIENSSNPSNLSYDHKSIPNKSTLHLHEIYPHDGEIKDYDLVKAIDESIEKLNTDMSNSLILLKSLGIRSIAEIDTESEKTYDGSYESSYKEDPSCFTEISGKPNMNYEPEYTSAQFLKIKSEIASKVQQSVQQEYEVEMEVRNIIQEIDNAIEILTEHIPTPLVDAESISKEQSEYKESRLLTYKYPMISLIAVFIAASIVIIARSAALYRYYPYFSATINCIGGISLTKKSLDKIAMYSIPRLQKMENIASNFVQKAKDITTNTYARYFDYVSRNRLEAMNRVKNYEAMPHISTISKELEIFDVNEKKLRKNLKTKHVISEPESIRTSEGDILFGNRNVPRSFRGHYMFRILVTAPVLTGVLLFHIFFVWFVTDILNNFQAFDGNKIVNVWSPIMVALFSSSILLLQITVTKTASKASRIANIVNKHLIKRENSIVHYRTPLLDTMEFLRKRIVQFHYLISAIASLSRVQTFHRDLVIDSMSAKERSFKKARKLYLKQSLMYSVRAFAKH